MKQMETSVVQSEPLLEFEDIPSPAVLPNKEKKQKSEKSKPKKEKKEKSGKSDSEWLSK
jgi:hypothetical protein